MDSAPTGLSKGQRKRLNKLKRLASSEGGVGAANTQPKTEQQQQPPKHQPAAGKKRHSPGMATAASAKGGGENDAGVRKQDVPKKKQKKDESVTMKGRSKTFAVAPGAGGGGGGSSTLKLKGASKLTSLQERMKAKLEGAKFRLLNERLYTSTGSEAFEAWSRDPALFEIYHRGYREQAAKWPENPLVPILAWLASKHPNAAVADFGCGDAVLACDAPAGCTVHSFDLVAANPRVTACDMAAVPLGDGTVDVAVFCLSLMGTNLADYLREARRVLRGDGKGVLKVAEVRSRFDGMEGGLKSFVGQVCRLGFKCVAQDKRNAMFVLLEFTATAGGAGASGGGGSGAGGRTSGVAGAAGLKAKAKGKQPKDCGAGGAGGAGGAAAERLTIDIKPCIYKRR